MKTITIFKNFTEFVENRNIDNIFLDIKNGVYLKEIEYIRQLIFNNDKNNAALNKNKLLAFTPSCSFIVGKNPKLNRTKELIYEYTGIIHLDYDHLSVSDIDHAIQILIKNPYILAFFVSPSGNGLKVFIKVDLTEKNHEFSYNMVSNYFDYELGITSDPKCKDIMRLCFVSYDPNAFINLDSTVFKIADSKELILKNNVYTSKIKPPDILYEQDNQQLFEKCIEYTQRKEIYQEGNRNNFIHLLACNCNRMGILEHITLDLLNTNFDLPNHEIKAVVQSVFKNNIAEFANSAKFANSANNKFTELNENLPIEIISEEDLINTCFLNDDIFERLPEILKKGANFFIDKRQRDVFLTSAVTILSGCLPNVKGIYSSEEVYPNLYCFIIAPAANGKSALKYAKVLADRYHEKTLKASKENQTYFQNEINKHKIDARNLKKGEKLQDEPQQPPFKIVFIPANTSYAKILQHLDQNEGFGIICETEADTMSNAIKQEWGGYSELLRKGFHHETFSSSKKNNNEFIEVNCPRLTVALSGTLSQFIRLINSSEDGLFSRMIYYVFKVKQEWLDVSPYSGKCNLTERFSILSNEVLSVVDFFEKSETNIELTKNQWDILNSTFSIWLKHITLFNGDEAGSVVKRLGLILYRIAMVLTSLRKFESQNEQKTITCSDNDFDIALKLSNSYLEHSVFLFNNLPSQDKITTLKNGNNKKLFFNELPTEFKRSDAINLGQKYKLSIRSVDEFLKKSNPILLSQPRMGYYEKNSGIHI